eukprot:CAMPEP_0203907252 /NCGR_PEP_ID=MMETSP0359-20131031/48764_1 /ASSEMBLY_ACC=CAM_ASM_000338 /TAXON_ID=268821 /ORGANISM="Scrippsiella Hangoei, Strain SHTV-5" /LENGTH=51 /DNA_ID=CAMNT_0050832031 /DNA_START=119 /DNA_END=274 /DNA_ORIENTATION=-
MLKNSACCPGTAQASLDVGKPAVARRAKWAMSRIFSPVGLMHLCSTSNSQT